MANKTLNATVKLNTKGAEQSLRDLERRIKAVNKAINSTSTGNNKLNKAIDKAVTSTNKLNTATKKVVKTTEQVASTTNKIVSANERAANSARKMRNAYASSKTAASGLLKTVKSLAATYLGVMGMKALVTASDTITSSENRLNNLPNGNEELTQLSMDKIYSAAQRSRSGYGDMLSNVSKSMTLASGSFKGNIDNAIKFQEIMSKAYTVGGASAAEQSSSMYQLIQALGSGVLQGDELRSVREGAPIAYKAIEEFAQGVLKTEESLKDLASQGLITSDMVVAAIMESEEAINKSFKNTQTTFAQAWEIIKNMALQAFRPVLQMLNDGLNKLIDSGVMDALGQVFVFIANLIIWICDLLGILFDWIVRIFNWISENWNWLSRVIMTALVIIAITMATVLFPKFIAWIKYLAFTIWYYAYLGVTAVASAIKTAAAWAVANWQLLLIILVIAAIVVAIIWLADSFEDACGMIVGVFMTGIAFIYNLFVGLFDGILQLAYALVSPFIGIFEWILNALNGGFNGFMGGLANGFGQILSWILDVVKVAGKAIDALFGTNTVGKLNELQNKVLSWGKNENAITISREAPTLSSLSNGTLDRWAYTDAYNTGYDWGSSGASWLTDKISGIGEYLTSYNDANTKVGASYLPDIDSATNALSTDDFLNGLDGIGSDVGDIKDSMDLSNDDLEFLRKIADMEWRNEFTTAEIRVDMTNNNTVSSERDLDGIVEYLSDVLRNEMTNVAYGVHY